MNSGSESEDDMENYRRAPPSPFSPRASPPRSPSPDSEVEKEDKEKPSPSSVCECGKRKPHLTSSCLDERSRTPVLQPPTESSKNGASIGTMLLPGQTSNKPS